MMKQAVSCLKVKQISGDATAELKSPLAGLCESMKDVDGTVNDVEGTMESFRGEMKGDVKNLDAMLADAFNHEEGLQRKRRTMMPWRQKMMQGFNNEENERRKVYDE